MSLIDDIVNISIKIGVPSAITRQGMSSILILVGKNNKPFTVRAFSSFQEFAEFKIENNIYFQQNWPEYIAAQQIFGQDLKPTRVLIGYYETGEANTETIVQGYIKVKEADDDFYGVIAMPLTPDFLAQLTPLAQAIETEKRILGVATADQTVLTQGDNNTMRQLAALNLKRTFAFYSSTAVNQRIEAALMGKMFARDAGSETWAYKNLAGVTADKLNSATTTYLNNIGDTKNVANYYCNFGGTDVTFNGQLLGGMLISSRHGIDWLDLYIQDSMAQLLVKRGVIPANNEGAALAMTVLKTCLEEAVARKIIDGDYEARVEKIDKANRTLTLAFSATQTSAIHKIKVNGIVEQ